MKKVFIGTVSSSATVSVYYLTSLFKSQKLLAENNIDCIFDAIIDEPLIQLARNRLLSIFIESDYDELIMIDSDQAWEPKDLLKLVNSDKDFIGAPVILKTDNRYNVSFYESSDDEVIEVEYVGTGFLKISRKVAQTIYDISEKYKSNNAKDAMAFEIKNIDENILSEDFVFCKKWKELGGSIFIDTTIDPVHVGNVTFRGNFRQYLDNMSIN